jgi:hypothetical protein
MNTCNNTDIDALNRHELSALFVTDYLGKYVAPNGCVYRSLAQHAADPLAGGYDLPMFADSTDLILQHLERRRFRIDRVRLPTGYIVYIELDDGTYVKAEHAQLARAACKALIKARWHGGPHLPPA